MGNRRQEKSGSTPGFAEAAQAPFQMGSGAEPAGSETVTVREANQGFSRLIAEVEAGKSFIVTKNSKPVARIISVEDDMKTREARRLAAMARMDALMNADHRSKDGHRMKDGDGTYPYLGRRDDIYDRSSDLD